MKKGNWVHGAKFDSLGAIWPKPFFGLKSKGPAVFRRAIRGIGLKKFFFAKFLLVL